MSGMGGHRRDGRGPLTRAEAVAAASALSDLESAYVLRHVAALAPEAIGAAVSDLRTYEAEHGPVVAPASDRASVTVGMPNFIAERLAVLAPDLDPGTEALAQVLGRLIDHAQQGVYRPGAWEREWIIQVFGYEWLKKRIEPDPEDPGHDRPRR